MQATLLSIAIALILALLAALVGPHFIDWNRYRSDFQAQASRVTGLDVRLLGPIEARLLPTPSVTLQRIDIVRRGEAGSLRARKLSIEFSLGSLIRGEWRATDVRLEGAEFALALDQDGRLEWPAPSIGFDPEQIAVERLDIRDSRALLADAASGSGVVLDKFEFNGELRTLAGPVKGQGSFYLGGQHYPYRVAASRVGDDGVRLRINVDPIDRPLTADAEGLFSIERGVPRFAGSISVARPVTRAPAGSEAQIIEPWRLTGKIDGNSKRAVIEQIEFQYGPEDRPIRLRGDASVGFGPAPKFTAVLSSPQLDLDRMLGLPDAQRRRPLAAIKAFAKSFAGSQRLPIPVDIGISVESLTLAGATLQRVSGDFSSGADGWTIANLELRAPGLTQVEMAGQFGITGDGVSFNGRSKVDSQDPKALIAWLTDRADAQSMTAKRLLIDGQFKLGSDEIAVERLRAEVDRLSVQGRLSYAWGSGQRPPRIEAVVSAPDIDLDRAYGVMQALFDGTVFDWPREGLVSARVDRATLAGIEAKQANISLHFNPGGLAIERLTIADFGGAALTVKGDIDTHAQSPRGAVTLDLDARRLEGLTELVQRISPKAAAELRRNAGRAAPARLSASLNIAADAASNAEPDGQFRIAGRAGAFQVSLHGQFAADHFSVANLSRLRTTKVDLAGEIDTQDGNALVELLGLERLVVPNGGRARATGSMRGALDDDLAVEANLVADGLGVSGKGTVRLAGNQGPTAGIDLTVARARLRVPGAAAAVPAALTAKLSLAEGVVGLTELQGKFAGTDVNGRLSVDLAEPATVAGELALGEADVPAAIEAAIGMPHVQAAWPAEPFERGLLDSLNGAVKLRIGRATLASALAVQDLRTIVQFGPGTLAINEIDGSIAGGRVAGSASFGRSLDGLSLDTRIRMAGVNVTGLVPGSGLTGQATINLDLAGTGRSPIALVGSLKGEGTFTLQDGQIRQLDPTAFATVMRNVDDGLPIDIERIRQRMEAALGAGPLPISLAQGEIAAAAGQLRLANTAVRAKGADLGVSASLDLASGTINARLSLASANAAEAPEGARPEVTLALRGPIAAPDRTLNVASFINWLALRAIEEKDKRIDALQRQAPVAPPPEATPSVPATPAAPINHAPLPQAVAPANTAPESPPASETRPPKQRIAPPRQPAAKALPPPTDIRPPRAAARSQPFPWQPLPEPGRPPARSWLENLLGP